MALPVTMKSITTDIYGVPNARYGKNIDNIFGKFIVFLEYISVC